MRRKNKGFTLVEMMVVVAIIGVLVGVVSVGVSSAIEKSREQVDIQNFKTAVLLLNKARLDGPKTNQYIGGKGSALVGNVVNTDGTKYSIPEGNYVTCVYLTQNKPKWQSLNNGKLQVGNKTYDADGNFGKYGYRYVYIAMDSLGNITKITMQKK